MVREIPLTQGYVALVDDEDYERVSEHEWHPLKDPRSGHVYAVAYINGFTTRMHRLILNAPPGTDVDHVNRNGLVNTRSNIRICSRSQNSQNRCLRSDSKSGYKGVTWCPSKDRWQARIVVGEKRISIGWYRSALEASKAYDEAAIREFGEFARTNHPAGQERAA